MPLISFIVPGSHITFSHVSLGSCWLWQFYLWFLKVQNLFYPFISQPKTSLLWFKTSGSCLTYYWIEDRGWDFEALSNSASIGSWVGRAVFYSLFPDLKLKLSILTRMTNAILSWNNPFLLFYHLPFNSLFCLLEFSFLSLTTTFLFNVFLRETF